MHQRQLQLVVVLMALVGGVLWDFLDGEPLFAFLDIGSDTYTQFVPMLDFLSRPGWHTWSFNVGLGALVEHIQTPFYLLNAWALGWGEGARAWVYGLKLLISGGAMYALVRKYGAEHYASTIAAVCYALSCFALVDGQWDPHSVELVFYPIVLWAVLWAYRATNVWVLPLAIGVAIWAGAFFASLGVFLLYVFLLALFVVENRRGFVLTCYKKVFPGVLLGFLLASPVLLPWVELVATSPRVSGSQSLFSRLIGTMFLPHDLGMWPSLLAAFFHKNLLGIGNEYRGFMNYLEGPGFYVGTLSLLLIPQLSKGNDRERRVLLVGGGALTLFLVFPFVRGLAFGFSVPYFRVVNLWVELLLLWMMVHALQQCCRQGVDRGWLVGTWVLWSIALLWLVSGEGAVIGHALKLVVFSLLIMVVMFVGFSSGGEGMWRLNAEQRLPVLLLLVCLELVWVGRPSFYEGRKLLEPHQDFYRDESIPALHWIRQNESAPFYRVEKTYMSVSQCDSLAQDYRGVKSYWFHSGSVVKFFIGMGLIPEKSAGVNYTNWLPDFGNRFALNALFGVKYLIAHVPVQLPGYRGVAQGGGVSVYHNDWALPLGVVYDKVVAESVVKQQPLIGRDVAMTSAAIVADDSAEHAELPSLDVSAYPVAWPKDQYISAVQRGVEALRRQAFAPDVFQDDHIEGTLEVHTPGVLVFSIPYSKGWKVRLNDQPTATVVANWGMTGVRVQPGRYRVVLDYEPPGRTLGLMLGGASFILLLCWTAWRRRNKV